MCDFGVFLSVRGTDATAGSGTNHSGRIYGSGGHGPQISPLVTKMVQSYMPMFIGSLRYPATGGSTYGQSVRTGRDILVTELNWIATQCGGYLPATVLAGHSQGAHVILDALTDTLVGPNLKPGTKMMIRAVVLYGDPTFRPHMPYNAPGSPAGFGGLGRTSVSTDQLKLYRVWGWSMESMSPDPAWVPKIRSYCKTGDLWCQSGTGSNALAIHNSYTTETTRANDYIHHMLSTMGG
ncbi:UNVERIFIED_CONTAM: cutinase family protein [Microbacterium sp. SLM126]